MHAATGRARAALASPEWTGARRRRRDDAITAVVRLQRLGFGPHPGGLREVARHGAGGVDPFGGDVFDDGWSAEEPGRAQHRAPLRRSLPAALQDRLPPALQATRWSLDGRALAVVALVGVLAVTAGILLLARSPRSEAVVMPGFTAAPVATSAPASGVPTADSSLGAAGAVVVVDVAGLVAHPGVYELPAGSRVIDAVEAAGGAVAGTDLSSLNLARIVTDGEQVAVGVPPAPPVPGGVVGGTGSGVGQSSPLDLNTATEAELDALPGVGPVLAARIVAWRTENGRFSSVDELLEVSGIGEATLADIAPLVRV